MKETTDVSYFWGINQVCGPRTQHGTLTNSPTLSNWLVYPRGAQLQTMLLHLQPLGSHNTLLTPFKFFVKHWLCEGILQKDYIITLYMECFSFKSIWRIVNVTELIANLFLIYPLHYLFEFWFCHLAQRLTNCNLWSKSGQL